MITNQILKSEDRELFGVKIRQETKTEFLNLSDLQEAYTRARVLNSWSDKKVQELFSYQENIERIYYLLFDRKIINSSLNDFIENINNIGFTKHLKQIGVYKTTGARNTKTTWCDPYIWVLVAMELNPQLYAKVVVWLTDKLIINRIEAGNFYKCMNTFINKISKNPNFPLVAIKINEKVFGKHETGIRNLATKEQLKLIGEIENFIINGINMGIITDENKIFEIINKYGNI